jgi:hypothetical protein
VLYHPEKNISKKISNRKLFSMPEGARPSIEFYVVLKWSGKDVMGLVGWAGASPSRHTRT